METNPVAPACLHCGNSFPIYSHNITSGIIAALIKVRRAVEAKGVNDIHNRKDMDCTPYELTKTEAANFTMLRYHGLVAKVMDDSGKHLAGRWLITRRGGAFLRGEQSIPRTVMVQNNRVVGHGQERVYISDIVGTTPRFTPLVDLDYAMPEGTLVQARLV